MSGTAAGTSGSQTGGTGLTLSNILADTINSYARDPNDMLNAALYAFGQSSCNLQAVFRRHAMDPRGRIAVSLPWESNHNKVWHATTRKELTILLETLHETRHKAPDDTLVLLLWEGADYEPPISIEFWREYEESATGAIDALNDVSFHCFALEKVAAIIPITGPAFDEGVGAEWKQKLVDKVSVLIGKTEV